MKETGIAHWISPNTGATNSSGFAGLPGGFRSYDGSFNDVGGGGYWWSSTNNDTNNAWALNLYFANDDSYRFYDYKLYGFSVRCLRD